MVMRKALLVAALLASTSLAAHAACNPSPPAPSPNPGNIVTFQCDSDNQATDGDDLKLFLDKATGDQRRRVARQEFERVGEPEHPYRGLRS
jgi:hypothetical protein